MAEMNTKTNAKTPPKRKVAPDVIVKSRTTRSSIDQLDQDNPDKSFVYASSAATDGLLSSQGLVPVKGIDGEVMQQGSRIICEDTGTDRINQMKSQHKEATDRIDEIKDKEQINSRDKVAAGRKPIS